MGIPSSARADLSANSAPANIVPGRGFFITTESRDAKNTASGKAWDRRFADPRATPRDDVFPVLSSRFQRLYRVACASSVMLCGSR